MKEKIIKKLISDEFHFHPEAELIDYYKLFFQGTFGPEHIIPNPESAYNYLKIEIENNTIFEKEFYQNISYLNYFYRVNLWIIKDGIVSIDEFFNAFLNSRKLENIISEKEWFEEWNFIQQKIIELNSPLKNLKDQIETLQKKIKDNNFCFHHSKIYKKKYHPHYRIISQKEFFKFKYRLRIT